MEIIKLKTLAKQAFKEIKQFQVGDKKVIKTGRPYLDDIFPVVNGSVITISAGSGVGKSYELATVIENILDRKLNPHADRYVVLNISLEMKILSIVLRGLNKHMGKSKRQILLEEFTEEEKLLAKKYYDILQDDRQYISQVPTSPNKFLAGCRVFLEEHRDKESVIIAADHIALFGSDKGQGKQQVIEDLIEDVNILKMEFPNVIFILLSQTNSEMLKRLKEKDVMSQPQPLDLYYSSFTFQVSDYVVVIVNPYKMGINEYSKINTARYEHLSKYFTEPDNKGRVSLDTLGVLYYHLLKCREADSIYKDIFAEDLNIPDIEKLRDKKQPSSIPTFEIKTAMPIFEMEHTNTTLNKIAGEGFDPFT